MNQSKIKMNNISSGGDNNNVDSPANVEEQLVVVRSDLVATAGPGGGGVVNGGQGGPAEKFAFSQLMRQMAQKYQDKNETTAERYERIKEHIVVVDFLAEQLNMSPTPNWICYISNIENVLFLT